LANLEKKHLSQVSRTLRKLRDYGFVEYKPSRSRQRYYSVTDEGYAILRRTDLLVR
jgi:DNA-binding MarR family transcriptional regulator